LAQFLSGGGSVPPGNTPDAWVSMINQMNVAALKSSSGIPIIYGIDAVHGNSNVKNATIFPHNIGLGAANDPELMKAIGIATAKEMLALA
jgi:beta-glucosidase